MPLRYLYLLPWCFLFGAPTTSCRLLRLPYWPSSLYSVFILLCLFYQGLFRHCAFSWIAESNEVLSNCNPTNTPQLKIIFICSWLLYYSNFHVITNDKFIKIRFIKKKIKKPFILHTSWCSFHHQLFYLFTTHSSKPKDNKHSKHKK